MLDKYIEAELAILDGKNVSFQGRTMGMEDLDKIRLGRQEWEQRVARGSRVSSGQPTFGGRTFSVARFGGDS
jgi:hypothetical protein